MNHYIFIRRLMGPAILLLLGTVALLHQAHLVKWSIFVPLLLILIGVIKLAERAVLAQESYPPYPPETPWPGSAPYPGAVNPPAPAAAPGAAIVPAETHDFDKDGNGGQS
jgi:hypothetical protein